MKQWSRRINEQGSDGEDVSQVDQQHQAIIESKNMAANQQKERTIHIGESDRWFDSRSRAAIRPVHPCSRAKVANKSGEFNDQGEERE